ncbi:hypothetical protein [Streptomyces caatingaensis]|uniref:Uncharacterized protein n=1 Tax=Streptomyces caatingaensis TaxID=1678637 RepID=A0A0K9XGA9_9ACTN|nr:hypothetical protein [Streptomyces caatingaensis]KNB52258.1 hypothetical protein AC230_11965 [Streptomyces caatingaensis]
MSDGDRAGEAAADAFDFNVDVRLTVKNNPSTFQFVNMTIETVPPGATQLDGTWRGAPVFLLSSGGSFAWDGRAGQEFAALSDGASGGLVVTLAGFVGAPGKLPGRGKSGEGHALDPVTHQFREDITWKIT